MQHPRTVLALLVPSLLLALAAALLVVPAEAATPTGAIHGTAVDTSNKRLSKIRVRVFRVQKDGSWAYLKVVSATSDGDYRANKLKAGTYVLQFVDTRPSYDTRKHVTKDVKVKLAEGVSRKQNVHLKVGASLYGKAFRHGRKAPTTILRAVRDGDTTGTVYGSRSNERGEYALGGLPPGTYTVFSYDHAKKYTAKPRRITLKRTGVSTKLTFRMNTRAGRYAGLVSAGGISLKGSPYVTAVNRTTGQFWVVKATRGSLSALRGLSPGRYTLKVPGADRYLGRTFNLPAVKAGRTTNAGTLDLKYQGGILQGRVVDSTSGKALGGVEVTINDKYGHPYETVRTLSNGRFEVGGSVPNGDNPVTLTIRARNPIDEVRYQEATKGPYTVKQGTRANLGDVSITPVPKPTPTATATPTPTATATATASTAP